MIEVEIRARVGNLNKVKNKLNEIGASFVKNEKQVDRIFGHPMFLDENKMIIEGGLSARIRENNEKNLLEFKEIVRKGGGMEVSSELNDVKLGLKFLEKLKFEEAFTVSKKRDIFLHEGFTICLDWVEGLGDFIEIEKMISSSDEKERVRQECLQLLHKIVPDAKIENRKYGDLMQEKINENK
jgi:adenylate cyclase class 2